MMDDVLFMTIALEEAKKAFDKAETPVGAIVVKDGEVIARAHNLRETLQDPTAHAEIIAIRDAAQKLGRWRLTDCCVYVTLEPCAMCAGAMVLARIQRLVYGTSDPKSGAVGSLMNLLSDERLNHKVDVESGILAKECGDILSEFFSSRRKKISL
jgi:tRNA(adenine34) deaminase